MIHGFSIFDQSTDQIGLALKNRDFRTGMLAIDLRNPVDIDSGHGATGFGIDFQQNLILRTIVTRIWNQSWSDPERNPGLDLLQAGSLFFRKSDIDHRTTVHFSLNIICCHHQWTR